MFDSKKLEIIYWVILAFRDYYVPGECEETPMGMMQEGIDNYLQGFDIQGGRFRIVDLKDTLLCAYQSDIELWWRLNCHDFNAEPPINEVQVEDDLGVQSASVLFWVEYFGLGKEFMDQDKFDEYFDKYHPEMLKLLVKCCVWDVLFPGETLPGYTVPTSADTSSFDYTA
ncbi:hypothetical protein CWB99_17125 [Pseudoalteromonas rubra]|uniref:Uncharacterized protein n=1 Tax=Pseudoalteromonas rubra TaxID=43658 RepID=A0A5S3WK51_9GAMM|nr:hypothetical protein [Pseudoalteromonas rubra]TMP26819.1 hypothetical protein CWB99_17125 [Pseudoalteromonas rubra]TMP33796.1 hypothetical protein CWC00_09820 [Pseudoalteromonas rubra]